MGGGGGVGSPDLDHVCVYVGRYACLCVCMYNLRAWVHFGDNVLGELDVCCIGPKQPKSKRVPEPYRGYFKKCRNAIPKP